jgi:beta-phosphoglucomutase-like phosphatase (HAD superfamily)
MTTGLLPGKPAPDTYLRATKNLGLELVDCIVVEDAFSGMQAAHALGIGHVIAIGPRSIHDRLFVMDGADKAIENLDEVRRSLFLG